MRSRLWLILAAGFVLGGLVSRLEFLPGPTVLARLNAQESVEEAFNEEEKRTIQIFESVSPSVVFITNRVLQRDFFSLNVFEVPQGAGSGFVWDKRGHIVTNYHVVHGASGLSVKMAGRDKTYEAVVVGAEPSKDIAVIRIDAPSNALIPIPQGNSGALRVGQTVLAIGNPFGLDHTLTKGIVSALGREIKSLTGRTIRDVIQSDAAINPGNSGGPLLDFRGRLVGINTAIFSPSGSSAGIGFAVPVNTVGRIVPQLVKHGKFLRPSLGVSILSEKFSQRAGIEGLIVRDVFSGGPAARAGLRGLSVDAFGEMDVGDILLAIDGHPVTTTDQLLHALEGHQIGDQVAVTIHRGGARKDVKVTLGQME